MSEDADRFLSFLRKMDLPDTLEPYIHYPRYLTIMLQDYHETDSSPLASQTEKFFH